MLSLNHLIVLFGLVIITHGHVRKQKQQDVKMQETAAEIGELLKNLNVGDLEVLGAQAKPQFQSKKKQKQQDVKMQETAPEIGELLKNLNLGDLAVLGAQVKPQFQSKKGVNNHHHHRADKHDHRTKDDHKNLLNIQTLNLIVKHNSLNKKGGLPSGKVAVDVDKPILRGGDEPDEVLQTRDGDEDRCGKGDVRCGHYVHDRSDEEDRRDRDEDHDLLVRWLSNYGKKYKVNNDVDAIVVELSNLDKFLTQNKLKRDNILYSLGDKLRCRGNRCGKGRYDDDSDQRREDDEDDEDRREDDLRCVGDRCGRGRNDKNNDDNVLPEYVDETLRCIDGKCGRGRYDRDLDDGLQLLMQLGKNYKIDDGLNAVVMNLGDFDNFKVQKSLKKPKPKYLESPKEVNKDLYDVLKELKNAKTVLLDINDVQNENSRKRIPYGTGDQALVKYELIKGLFGQFQEKKDRRKKDFMKEVREEQRKDRVKRLMVELQPSRNDENYYTLDAEDLAKYKKPRNNKVRVQDIARVIARGNALPLTKAERKRILNDLEKETQKNTRMKRISGENMVKRKNWRRNSGQGQQYGVPFDLEVSGLGQANY